VTCSEEDRWVWEDGAHIPRCHWHFHRRLRERYGIVLEPGEFGMIVRQFKKKQAVQIGRDLYAVRIRQTVKKSPWIFVVKNGGWPHNDLVTVYPSNKDNRKAFARATEARRSPC
jgi:hypothetical protein